MTQRYVSFESGSAEELLVCTFNSKTKAFNVLCGKAHSFELRKTSWFPVGSLDFNKEIFVDSFDLSSPIKNRLIQFRLTEAINEASCTLSNTIGDGVISSLVTGLIEDACFCKNGNTFKHGDGRTEAISESRY